MEEDLFNVREVSSKERKGKTTISHINFVLKHPHLMYQLWLLSYALAIQ